MPDAGRVVAGSARGLRLQAPGDGTRPLGDRVKESVFAALEAAGALEGTFLDLFAGSGAAGIEALSRGARWATFVEHDRTACATITANVRRAHLDDVAQVVRADVVTYLRDPQVTRRQFDAVFVDPPYGDAALTTALELLGDASSGWLSANAAVVAKHFWREELPLALGSLERGRVRRFGETMITFYTRAQEEP